MGLPAPLDLEPPDFHTFDPADRSLDKRQPVVDRADRSCLRLLPRDVGDHHDHAVEVEGVARVDRGDEMADVDGVERAPKDADPFGHWRPTLATALSAW